MEQVVGEGDPNSSDRPAPARVDDRQGACSLGRLTAWRGADAQGQREREDGAHTHTALHTQVAAMRPHNPVGQGQPQTRVAIAASARRIRAVKGLEEVWQVLRRDARSRIAHCDDGAGNLHRRLRPGRSLGAR
jgi:hypothetical protein